ncbi:MAG: hypothetical protein WCJ62_10390 [Flavobacterium sp.]
MVLANHAKMYNNNPKRTVLKAPATIRSKIQIDKRDSKINNVNT